MELKKKVHIACFITVATFGLIFKVLTSENQLGSLEILETAPHSQILSRNFTYIGKHRLINDEAYTAYVYRASQLAQCEGELYVVPMDRNAEAVALLSRLSDLGQGEVHYLLGHTWHKRFPAVRFWMQRLLVLLTRLTPQEMPKATVYGVFAPFGCGEFLEAGAV